MPPVPQIKWKESNTPRNPYKQRRETLPEAVHTQAEWERHKDAIINLRRTLENAKIVETLRGLGFVVSEAQLKHQLKRWGERKNLKLTDNQIEHIVEHVEERRREGKISAVRLDGIKIPSKRIGAYLSRKRGSTGHIPRSDQNGSDLVGGGDPDLQSTEVPEGDSIKSFFDKAPTFIDSLQISVYTSSTAQGIRSLFRRQTPQPWIERHWRTRAISENLPEDVQPSQEWVELLINIFESHILEPHSRAWHPGRFYAQPIFGFDPELSVVRGTGQRVYHITEEQASMSSAAKRDLTLKLHEANAASMSQNLRAFLKSNSGKQQLYRRRIDLNDCPDNLWAVDLAIFLSFNYDINLDGTFSFYDKHKRNTVPAKSIAWCTREFHVWERWTHYYQDSLNQFDSLRFNCGHALKDLIADGPVIFTIPLEEPCWKLHGCQWDRIWLENNRYPRNHEEEVEVGHWHLSLVRSAYHCGWSASRALIV